jgi:arylsulfatase A-like enzyme
VIAGPDASTAPQVAEAAVAFLQMRADQEQPFYLQLGFFETHSPFDFGGAPLDDSQGVFVPPYLKTTAAIQRTLAQFQGAVHRVDQAIGRITRALRDTGLERDTLLVFTVDHGLELPRAKWTLYDPGIEVAMIARWPGGDIQGGRTLPWMTSHVDFVPTVLELVGLDVPDNVQGLSFAGGLTGARSTPARDAIFGYYQKFENRCIRTATHKLTRNFIPASLIGYRPGPVDIDEPCPHHNATYPVVLADLQADPHEFDNVANDPAYAKVLAELDDRLWRWLTQQQDPILGGPTQTPFFTRHIDAYQHWRSAERSEDA